MKIQDILNERKVDPSDQQRSQVWYHGTSTRAGYDFIMTNGLKVDLDWIAEKYIDSVKLTPLDGAYLSKDFGVAVDYSMNSDIKVNHQEPFGYVFEFDGKELSKISPDEDELGHFLIKLLTTRKKLPPSLQKIVDKTPQDIKDTFLGKTEIETLNIEPSWIAVAGKWLIQNDILTVSVVKYLMTNNLNLVNYGTLQPRAYWSIPKLPNGKFLHTNSAYAAHGKSKGTRHNI
jgi:hypothetical protein